MPLDPLHARVLRLAAALPEAETVALAGGGAMLAHGIVERFTRDVDLFTDRDAGEAVAVAASLRAALATDGLSVEPARRPPHENRFVAVDPDSGERVQVEVFPDGGRLHEPVRLDVGPVLHRDDLAADKVLAMWGRGEPRDYLDVAALLAIYGETELLALAASKDSGLTAEMFVPSLNAVRRLADRDWADAGIDPERARRVRETILAWRDRLVSGPA